MNDTYVNTNRDPWILRGVKKLTAKRGNDVAGNARRRRNSTELSKLTRSEIDFLDSFLIIPQTTSHISNKNREKALKAIDKAFDNYCEDPWDNCDDSYC